MDQISLKPGTLVRYNETTTRWYLSTIRSVDKDGVELQYIDSYRHVVDPSRVTPFISWLKKRSRVLSLYREDPCFAVYGTDLNPG